MRAAISFQKREIKSCKIRPKIITQTLEIFGPRWEEETAEERWRKLHNEELNYLYCSPNIVLVIKSRRMRWTGHIERMRIGDAYSGFLVGKPEGKRLFG